MHTQERVYLWYEVSHRGRYVRFPVTATMFQVREGVELTQKKKGVVNFTDTVAPEMAK